jgi:hypothetical protein
MPCLFISHLWNQHLGCRLMDRGAGTVDITSIVMPYLRLVINTAMNNCLPEQPTRYSQVESQRVPLA